MDKVTLLTRYDREIGEGSFDSIQWALETHVDKCEGFKLGLGLRERLNSAFLYGNEDAPQRIEFFCSNEPTIYLKPDLVVTFYGEAR